MDRTPEFERDRDYLVALLRELKARIEESDGLFYSDIRKYSAREEKLELACRLGFPRPLFIDETTLEFLTSEDRRQKEEDEKLGQYDTFGPRSMELASAHQRRVLRSLVFNDPQGGGGQYSSVAHLLTVIDRWTRTLRDMRSPSAYPALPQPFDTETDERLQSDPLWRHLRVVDRTFDAENLCDTPWSLEAWPSWIRKLNDLADYDLGIRKSLISVLSRRELRPDDGDGGARQVQQGLIIQQPGDLDEVTLNFGDGARLEGDSVKRLRDALDIWRTEREFQLRSSTASDDTANPVPRSARRAGRRRQGRPKVHSPGSDRKTAEAWTSSGCRTFAEYEQRTGLPADEVKLAVARDRTNRGRTNSANKTGQDRGNSSSRV